MAALEASEAPPSHPREHTPAPVVASDPAPADPGSDDDDAFGRPPDVAPASQNKPSKKEEREEPKQQQRDDSESDSEASDDEEESEDEGNSEEEDFEAEGVPHMEPPYTAVLYAQKYSGKTNGIKNMVRPSEWDNVFVITRTKRTGNLNSLVHDKRCVLEECSERFLEEVLRYQNSFEHKQEPRTLFIFDDFRGTKWKPTSSLALSQLASSGRNAGISMIFSTQDPKFVPTEVRRNSEYTLIGNNSLEIIDKLSKNFASAALEKSVMQEKLLDIARTQDYRFLWLDTRKRNWQMWRPELAGV